MYIFDRLRRALLSIGLLSKNKRRSFSSRKTTSFAGGRRLQASSSRGSSRTSRRVYQSASSDLPRRGSHGKISRSSRLTFFFLWVAGLCIVIPGLIGAGWFYVAIVRELPDIADIETVTFSQGTVITDRHGEELYKLFDQNREYVPFEQISENFVHAIIATEDQRFWTNPGVDWKGTLRALITDITQGKTHGGSTITQQLIKQLLLTPEKKIERKLKEMILALRLNDYLRDQLKKTHPGLSGDELERKVKENILELYSNYIFFGNNAYGIQIASKTYFGVDASELDVLQAAILAGIPQAPSRYDAYGNRGLLMGEIHVVSDEGTPVEINEGLERAILERVEENMNSARLTFRRNNEALIAFMQGLLDFTITYQGQPYKVSYRPGRKDVVLGRMLEESYITENEFKKQFLRGLTFEFERPTIEIKAPHFVFWVTRMLEQKYDSDLLRQGGLTIRTSLDYSIQKMAEESINENHATAQQYNANNAAMIYIDSQNGDVLAYVGSRNFYDESIDGQVDVVQAMRQPGSAIKPFVYALGFMNLPLTLDSPIYDLPITLDRNNPSNADGQFIGLTTLRQALAASRNIPAIKMLLMAGGEGPFKTFFQRMGVESLDMTPGRYGYPIAIGANEMTMLELANAYAHLSAMGSPAEIDPILEIRASDGSLLYRKQTEQQETVVPPGVAFLMWRILSESSNMPTAWISRFTLPGLTMGIKTGTTNVVDPNSNRIFPRDGWLAAYTPSKVMVFWGGNTNGNAMNSNAYGGWINNTAWRNFVTKLQQAGHITNQLPEQRDVSSVSISRISGKLATDETPLSFVSTTLGYSANLPTEEDQSITPIMIDNLCQGVPTALTPDSDLRQAYVIAPPSPMPDRRDMEAIIERWSEEETLEKLSTDRFIVLLEAPDQECEERQMLAEQGEISLELIQPTPGQAITRNFAVWHQTRSPFRITSLKIFLNDVELRSSTYNRQGGVMDITNVSIPDVTPPGEYTLKLIVTDEKGFTDTQTVDIQLVAEDTTPPFLMEDRKRINKRDDGSFEVVLLFNDYASTIREVTVHKDGEEIFSTSSNLAVFSVPTAGEISYTVIDSSNNRGGGILILE